MEKVAGIVFWSLITITSLVILVSSSMYLYEALVDPYVTDLTIIKTARKLLALGVVGTVWSFVSGWVYFYFKDRNEKKGSEVLQKKA